MTDSALYWIRHYDFDGFRHDAAKHIPESYWRLLTKKIRKERNWNHLYQIGETYGSVELVRSYVKVECWMGNLISMSIILQSRCLA